MVQATHSPRKTVRNLTKPKQRNKTPNTARKAPSSAKTSLFRKPRMIPLTASITASRSVSDKAPRSFRRILSAIFLTKTDQPVEVMHIAFKSYMNDLLPQGRILAPNAN